MHTQLIERACMLLFFSTADPNLTVEHVADVLSLLKWNWYGFLLGANSPRAKLGVPISKADEIRRQHQSQQLASLSAYIVQFIPGISWAVIAGALYYCCEERALQEAKKIHQKGGG